MGDTMEQRKIATLHFEDNCRNKTAMRVFVRPDESIHVTYGSASCSHSLSNLQMKKSLPEFRYGSDEKVIGEVIESVKSGVYRNYIKVVERSPRLIEDKEVA